LSKEALAKVRDAVKRGKLLPQDATRDELREYNMLASDITKKTKKVRLTLETKKEIQDNINYLPSNNPEVHGRRQRVKISSTQAKIQQSTSQRQGNDHSQPRRHLQTRGRRRRRERTNYTSRSPLRRTNIPQLCRNRKKKARRA